MLFWRLLFLFLLPAGILLGSGRKPPPLTAETEYMTVKHFAKSFGFTQVKEAKDSIHLKGPHHELLLYQGQRKARLNGVMLYMNEPLTYRGNEWTVSGTDLRKTIRPLLIPGKELAKQGDKIIVIDPGHGGADPGAEAHGMNEKSLVLDVAKRMRSTLQAQGYKVMLTRHNDQFLELKERPRRAAAWQADLFISLHVNAASSSAKGGETFVLSIPGHLSTNDPATKTPSSKAGTGNAHDEANVALGYALQRAMMEGTPLEDRGLRRARFQVLREAQCPAALVEIGFLTHSSDAKRLSTAAGREQVALSLSNGVGRYMKALRKTKLNHTEETKQP